MQEEAAAAEAARRRRRVGMWAKLDVARVAIKRVDAVSWRVAGGEKRLWELQGKTGDAVAEERAKLKYIALARTVKSR